MIELAENITIDNEKNDPRKPAALKAIQLLIDKLTNGLLESGQALKESVLAKEFDLSRAAVREALNQAVGWGIFEYVPYCGYRVRKFTSQDILEWYEMREAIEPIAARRIARVRPIQVLNELEEHMLKQEKALKENDLSTSRTEDMKFHLTVVRNCGNRRFAHLQNVGYLGAVFFFDHMTSSPARYKVAHSTLKHLPKDYTEKDFDAKNVTLTIAKHREMFEAIKGGDTDKAEALFKEHANNQVRNLENIIMYYGHLSFKELAGFKNLDLS
jgi:DNA-binding GntR family transcriptional regulator